MNHFARSLFQTQKPVLIISRGLKKATRIPITLAKDIPGLGSAGEVVYVNKAHMRHELYPKHLAAYVIARTGPLDRSVSAEKVEGAPSRKDTDVQKDIHLLALKNQDIIGRIVKLKSLVFKRSVIETEGGNPGSEQTIYGSLSKVDVIKELESTHGIIVDKSALSMDDKIKTTGNYTCTVKLVYAGQASLKEYHDMAALGDKARTPKTFAGTLGRASGSPGPHGLIEGEEAEQVESMHRRLLYILTYVVGSPVKVTTKSNDVYVGILDSINPNDAQSVVLRYAYNRTGNKVMQPVDRLVISGSDCLCISSVVSLNEDGKRDGQRFGFKTDTDISGTGVSGKGGERELHKWVPDESDALGALESELGHSGDQAPRWDQFATNEEMFGLTTDYDEEFYTTKLDRTRSDFKEREREAIRIAQEIQSTPFLNSHVAEERTEVGVDDNGALDEEDRYGAVLRASGAPGKYVPPYLRGKLDASQPAKQGIVGDSQSGGSSAADASSPTVATAAKHASPESAFSTGYSNSSGTVAALAKLNIRTSGHSFMQNSETLSAAEASPGSFKTNIAVSASPNTAVEPTGTTPLKQSNIPADSKLANLRGLKNRLDVAALNKPMADITEKLHSERERIKQHKHALLKNRMSELVKFHESFKLSTPMPDDVAEIVGAKKKSPPQEPETSTFNSSLKASPELGTNGEKDKSAVAAVEGPQKAQGDTEAKKPSQTDTKAAETGKTTTKTGAEATPAKRNDEAANSTVSPAKTEAKQSKEGKGGEEAKTGEKAGEKAGFKLNTKASSFKPRAAATPFVPKIGTSTSRASSAAGVSEFNPFFGRRVLKKTGMRLWGDGFKLDDSSEQEDTAPTWPFGSRTYRSQFAQEEPEVMMYSSSHGGYMHRYGYGYYNPYQYPPPPQMGMMGPGVGPPMSAAQPYSVAGYGGNGPSYAGGLYNTGAAYPSPIMAAGSGNSPVMAGMSGAAPPTAHPLPHVQGTGGAGTGGSASGPVGGTPEMAADMFSGQVPPQQQQQQQQLSSSASDHAGRSRSDSPSVMYGTPPIPPVHMGMVPPPMGFSGMQSSGYMSPMPPMPHQGYGQQSVAVPMGYAQYPPSGQVYGASPPGMVMMHGSPHPDQGTPGGHHSQQHHHHPGY
ncbi:poly(A)-binding protein binding protein [Coemansia sp. RSA 1933]|nr:poly(A)-binding protein binding protein [Coemansia sp. RSA 1933]